MQATVLFIGIRKVRSAGKASGSIEITLPPELAALEGISCRIVLRDGARPEIVLEPDLTPAVAIFTRAWNRLRALLRLAGDIGDFPAQECELALLPDQRQNGRPLLIYSYAWQASLLGQRFAAAAPAAPVAEQRAALVGLVAPLATLAGHRLGLVSTIAAGFGNAVAALTYPSGQGPTSGPESFEAGVARHIWNETCGPDPLPLDVLASQGQDSRAQQALQRIVSQFRGWQEHPDAYALSRARWRGTGLAW